MYALRVPSGTPPAEAAKYDRDHRCSQWVRTRLRWRSRRAETPVREFMAGDRDLRRVSDEQVDMVVLTAQLDQLGAEVRAYAGEHLAKGAQVLAS
jgi:hypothetical protein